MKTRRRATTTGEVKKKIAIKIFISRQQRKKIEIEPSHSDGLQLVQISWKKRKLFT